MCVTCVACLGCGRRVCLCGAEDQVNSLAETAAAKVNASSAAYSAALAARTPFFKANFVGKYCRQGRRRWCRGRCWHRCGTSRDRGARGGLGVAASASRDVTEVANGNRDAISVGASVGHAGGGTDKHTSGTAGSNARRSGRWFAVHATVGQCRGCRWAGRITTLTARQVERRAGRQAGKQAEIQADKQAGMQPGTRAGTQAGSEAGRQMDRWTERPTNRPIDRQQADNRPTNIYTDRQGR